MKILLWFMNEIKYFIFHALSIHFKHVLLRLKNFIESSDVNKIILLFEYSYFFILKMYIFFEEICEWNNQLEIYSIMFVHFHE
jgi:hypothetical protein